MTSRLVTADVDVLDWALFILVSGSPDVGEANTGVETVEEHEWKGEMHDNLPGCHPEKPIHNLHANVLLPEGSEYPKADVDDDEESDDATSGFLTALLRLVRVNLHGEDDDARLELGLEHVKEGSTSAKHDALVVVVDADVVEVTDAYEEVVQHETAEGDEQEQVVDGIVAQE